MKKNICIVIMLFSIILCASCAKNNSSKVDSIEEIITNVKIVPQNNIDQPVEAGNSFIFNVFINNNPAKQDYEFKTTVISGNEFCTINKNSIYISTNTPNNTIIKFFITISGIQSQNISFSVSNQKQVLNDEISDKTNLLNQKKDELSKADSKISKSYKNYNDAENSYYSYEQRCKNAGYLTPNGDYKPSTPMSVLRELSRLQENVQKYYSIYMQNIQEKDKLEKEIEKIEKEIKELKDKLSSM